MIGSVDFRQEALLIPDGKGISMLIATGENYKDIKKIALEYIKSHKEDKKLVKENFSKAKKVINSHIPKRLIKIVFDDLFWMPDISSAERLLSLYLVSDGNYDKFLRLVGSFDIFRFPDFVPAFIEKVLFMIESVEKKDPTEENKKISKEILEKYIDPTISKYSHESMMKDADERNLEYVKKYLRDKGVDFF